MYFVFNKDEWGVEKEMGTRLEIPLFIVSRIQPFTLIGSDFPKFAHINGLGFVVLLFFRTSACKSA